MVCGLLTHRTRRPTAFKCQNVVLARVIENNLAEVTPSTINVKTAVTKENTQKPPRCRHCRHFVTECKRLQNKNGDTAHCGQYTQIRDQKLQLENE